MNAVGGARIVVGAMGTTGAEGTMGAGRAAGIIGDGEVAGTGTPEVEPKVRGSLVETWVPAGDDQGCVRALAAVEAHRAAQPTGVQQPRAGSWHGLK